MASRRTKSIGTKVTPEEYDRIHALARDQPVSEWVRTTLLQAADGPSRDDTVLTEVLALRTILLNLHFSVCSGAPVTADTMRQLIERADREKRQQAASRLVEDRRPHEA